MKGWVSDQPAAKVGGLREIHGWNHGFQRKKKKQGKNLQNEGFYGFFQVKNFRRNQRLWKSMKHSKMVVVVVNPQGIFLKIIHLDVFFFKVICVINWIAWDEFITIQTTTISEKYSKGSLFKKVASKPKQIQENGGCVSISCLSLTNGKQQTTNPRVKFSSQCLSDRWVEAVKFDSLLNDAPKKST